MLKFQTHLLMGLCGFFATEAFAQTAAGTRVIEQKNGQVVVQGVVLDAAQKPLAGVETNAVVLSHRPKDHPLAGGMVASVAGRATTDASGSFSMRIRRTSAPQDIALELFAYAMGHGIAGSYLEMGQDRHDLKVELHKELTITAKLLGPGGEPLPAASIALCTLSIPDGKAQSHPFSTPPPEFSAWPLPYITTEDGEFMIRGANANTELVLELDDKRVARQRWTLPPRKTPEPVTLRAEPPRNVEGQVVAGESRLPIAGATVVLKSSERSGLQFIGNVTATTDALGRFTLRPYQGSRLSIRVTTADASFPPLARDIPWIDGPSTQRMVLPLYGPNYKRQDGTTPDGRAASTIEADYPLVKVDHCRPTEPLTAKLTGTILADASFTKRAGDDRELMQGVVAIDPETGQWRMIAKHAHQPRISSDGKQLAYLTAESGELQTVSLRSPEIPRPIAKKSVGPACWMPGADELVVNVHAPARRDYQGEEYWGLECETWRFNTQGGKLGTVAIPSLYGVYDISPDGRSVALDWDTHASLTGSQLFIARLDGSDLKPIARKRRQYYWYPRFSPDGKTVLAKHLNATNEGPWISARIIALDGSHERSITVHEGFDPEYACWSPDGRHIAIAACDDAPSGRRTSKLFIVDSQGAQIREVALASIDGLHLGTIDWTARHVILP